MKFILPMGEPNRPDTTNAGTSEHMEMCIAAKLPFFPSNSVPLVCCCSEKAFGSAPGPGRFEKAPV